MQRSFRNIPIRIVEIQRQSAFHGMTEIVKLLAANGAALNSMDDDRMPPLIAAILSGNRELVEWLLEQQVDARVRFRGRSATDYARDTNDPALIQLIAAKQVRAA